MINGGVVTVYVSDMSRAVTFYTETLGLKLLERYGDHWASIDAGNGLTIGLHPATAEVQAGRKGSIAIGLYVDLPIQEVVQTLQGRGVSFASGVVDDKAVSIAFFADPDGNDLYLAQMKYATR